MLYCPNYSCQAPNAETHHFCERCRTRLPKRYVWGIGQAAQAVQVGQYLGDRYLCKAPRIFLDTQPGVSPTTLDTIPESVLPYLKLNAYQANVPQAYGWATIDGTTNSDCVLLLEQAAIATPIQSKVLSRSGIPSIPSPEPSIALFPSITEQWAQASAMRQLNWLWQLAKLWQPLASERVVSSLLNPELIRTEDSLIRLLELQPDQRQTAGVGASLFNQLGILWQQWLNDVQPSVHPFLEGLCQHLIDGSIKHPGQLVACLDRALTTAGQFQVRQIQLASQTDKGPTRPRNEDACYPKQPGTIYLNSKSNKKTAAQLESSLVIVCDGIGGHLGGAVASGLAIDKVHQHLCDFPFGRMRPLALITELRKAVCSANDLISERNDQEDRRDRERMGTTLVMGLVQNHELYITHLGDSRAYLITQQGCHQITLDDDVASREARLGYGTYRSALVHPGSGSLVQALGMGSSGSLHPTVQRIVLDGDGMILLCSDGLSDNDLVDGLWQSHLLPLLGSKARDLADAVKNLVDEANQQNGHDNVTVGLIRWSAHHPSAFTLDASLAIPPQLTFSIPGLSSRGIPHTAPQSVTSAQKQHNAAPTKLVSPEPVVAGSPPTTLDSVMSLRSLISLLFGIVFLLSLGGILAYVLLPSVSDRIDTWLGFNDSASRDEELSTTPENSSLTNDNGDAPRLEAIVSPLQIGAFVQISRSDLSDRPGLNTDDSQPILTLYPEPSFSPTTSVPSTDAVSTSSETAADQAGASVPVEDASPSEQQQPEALRTEETISAPSPIFSGTVLKIIRQQEDEGQRRWIRLMVCQIPVNTNEPVVSGETQESIPNIPLSELALRPGDIGWMTEEDLRSVADLNPTLEESQLNGC
ncbi:MAG: protein phosphatase 2C domain-containing protein [Cyanobacteria bacterium P01_E01_bin.6]